MKTGFRALVLSRFVFLVTVVMVWCGLRAEAYSTNYLSPSDLVATKDGKSLFIACATDNRVLHFNTSSREKVSILMPDSPSGMALSTDERKLFVTCAAPESKVCVVDVASLKIIETMPAGHTSLAPVVSPDGKTLFVCNQFNNDVSVIDLKDGKTIRRIAVQREPVAADVTKDGKYLLVANQLPAGRADAPYVAAVVSVIDLAAGNVVREIQLPHGGTELKDIRISPDGKNAVVTFVLGRFYHPTTDVFRGWMNANCLAVIDMANLMIRGTVILDEPDRGAANPWGITWSVDGSKLLVTHAGTHEVSVIDFPAVISEMPKVSSNNQVFAPVGQQKKITREQAELSNYSIPFLVGARQRVKLFEGDWGPRAVVVLGHMAYTANYFSDTLGVIDLDEPVLKAKSIALGPKPEMDVVRQGEFNFHNASLCYQGWQSCSSCHPGNARVDGLNWDLLNDGIGNPKNTKNLLLAHRLPPVMSLGVRTNAETAVRAGIKFILFTNQPEAVAVSIDEYLKSLKPLPSPYLMHGHLSEAAKRGERIFQGAGGCADCHVPGLYSDLRPHDVGTQNQYDKKTDKFYTPTLIEVWRTAPYLHDGSAAKIRDVLTTSNLEGLHGDASELTDQQINDLCEYVLSL